ncbi:MAG: MCE family protein [Deltaproteobacteria bacterium]|nr:MCE family protein [Deltaproteobacteria bacterium]
MSTQANKKAIGLFVIAALALVVGIIVIFGSGKFFKARNKFVAYFEGSVKGLRVGAPVVFRGVEIGEVTRINIYVIHEDQSFLIPVIFEINSDRFHAIGPDIKHREKYLANLIEKGLRAQLQMQSLVTGQLMINIDFYPDKPLSLVGDKGLTLPEDVMEIPTIQTPLQRIGKTLEEIPLSEILRRDPDLQRTHPKPRLF